MEETLTSDRQVKAARPPGDDLVDLARTLWAGRWLLLAAMAAGILVAIAVSFVVTPLYRGESVVVIEDEEADKGLAGMLGELGGLASLAGVNIGGSSGATDETLAYVSSRELGTKFLRDSGLVDTLLKAPHLRWDLWSRDDMSEDQRVREAYRLFDREVRGVRFDKKSGVLRVGIDWPDPVVAANWSNAYVALANAELRRRALVRYDARRKFLERELGRTDQVELRNATAKLLDSQLRMAMVASSREDFALKTVDPAVPALPRDRLSPRRAVYATFGLLAGLTLAGLFVLWRGPRPGTARAPRS